MGRDIQDVNFMGPRLLDKFVLSLIVMSLYWRVRPKSSEVQYTISTGFLLNKCHTDRQRSRLEIEFNKVVGGTKALAVWQGCFLRRIRIPHISAFRQRADWCRSILLPGWCQPST